MNRVDFWQIDELDDDVRLRLSDAGLLTRQTLEPSPQSPLMAYARTGDTIAAESAQRGIDPSRLVALCYEPAGLPAGCLWLSPEALDSERVMQVVKSWLGEAQEDYVQSLLAQISHDMRAPLSVITTAASLIGRVGADHQKASRYLSLINESSGVLKALVSDILDYSNIRQGEFSFSSADFNLPQLLFSVAESFQLLVKTPEVLSIHCILEESLPDMVHGDPGRLRQVLTNLLNNALKFTSAGTITLSAQEKDGLLYFAVEDTGIGIRPEALEQIFLPYQQVERSGEAESRGIGLGLTICRELVRRMGGRIGVESEFGRGSRFWFTARLPLAQSQPISSLPELVGARVLLVTRNGELLPSGLSDVGKLRVVATIAEAEAALSASSFEICVVDLDLGQWDFVRRVVELAPECAVVVATAVGQRGDVALCKEMGVAGYLTAPLDKDLMATALALVLDRSRHDIVTKYSAKEFIAAREA